MRNKTLKVFVFILIFVLLAQVGLEASTPDKINMSFKDADLRDVLRTIAELSDVNLITDTKINDTITINLSDISFVKALDVLTQSNKLDYRIDDNIVVVSTTERLDEIYSKVELEIVSVNSANLDDVKTIVNGVYPDVNLQLDKVNQQIIITGIRERITLAEKLISKIDLPVDKNDSLEIIELTEDRGQNSLIGLETIFENMEFIELNDKLIVKGEKNSIKEVRFLIEELELTPEEKNVDNDDSIDEVEETTEITFMPLKYSDIEKTAHLLENVFPEINIQQDERNQQLVIITSPDQTKEIKGFLEEIDVPLPPEEKNTTTKMLDLDNTLAAGEVEKIKVLYPDLLLVKIQETLVIRGQERNVDQALNFIEDIKKKELQRKEEEKIRAEQQELEEKAKAEERAKITEKKEIPEEKITRIVAVDHVNPENLKQMINDVYPDLQIVLDTENKRLIFNDTPQKIARAEKLMEELNIPQKQVIIEVRIEEISRTDLKKIGVDPDQLSQINFIQGNNNNITGVEVSLPSFLKALREEGKSKTLASPRLMTLNGEQASLLIGDVLYVETGTGENTAIETIEAGINLDFRPWVTAEKEIVLEVNPQVSSFDTRADGGIASVNTREANTKVRLEDGQMIAIGGLIQEKEIENISGIPILSEIPILGKIFKQHSVESDETELLILITPTIVEHNIVQDSIENDVSLGRKVPEDFVLEKDLQQTISEADKAKSQQKGEDVPTTEELAVLILLIGAIYGLVN